VVLVQVDEKPTESYQDVGGLEKQMQEMIEAIVLPMTHKEKFDAIGIKPPKGCLMYGPPGTGKTLMARACAAQTNACFLKLAGPQLVQMFIGDGAKLVRCGSTHAFHPRPPMPWLPSRFLGRWQRLISSPNQVGTWDVAMPSLWPRKRPRR
jgi:ATP-dependent 26S proteasome regulatory subunit